MAKTKKTTKRSLASSSYDVERIILGVLLALLVVSAVVYINQNRSQNGQVGEPETSTQESVETTEPTDEDDSMQREQ